MQNKYRKRKNADTPPPKTWRLPYTAYLAKQGEGKDKLLVHAKLFECGYIAPPTEFVTLEKM